MDGNEKISNISETTKVQLSITSWFHVVLIIITIVACYFGLQGNISSAIAAGAKNTADIQAMQNQETELKVQLQKVLDGLENLKQQITDKRLENN